MSGTAVADRLGSAPLRADVIGTYLHGMSLMLGVSAGLAVLCAVLAVAFMPRHRPAAPEAGERESVTMSG